MPLVRERSVTTTTTTYDYSREELLAVLGHPAEPGEAVSITVTPAGGLQVQRVVSEVFPAEAGEEAGP